MKKFGSEFKNVMCIYKIVNKITGKVYIGSTVNLYSRVLDHIKNLNSNKHDNAHLQNSWNAAYSKDNFYIEIVELVEDQTFLVFAELYYIEKYRRLNGVYNISNPLEEDKLIKSRNKPMDTSKPKNELKSEPKIKNEIDNDEYMKLVNQISGQFEYLIESIKEKLTVHFCISYMKIHNFVVEKINIDKSIENEIYEKAILRVLRDNDISILNFESEVYSREVLKEYGIELYEKMILSKENTRILLGRIKEYKATI